MTSLLLAFSMAAAPSSNWPQFRGPLGDGTTTAKLPTTWSEKDNIRWKTAIHDKGWSSPVVWGAQIWLTTAKADGREFYAVCLDKTTGKILHDVPLFSETTPAFCHAFNSYASPTPVIEEGRVYCHFGAHGTVCLDTATAKPIWSNRELKCDHFRGPGSSPVLFENLLILTFDGVDVQYVTALDKATGKPVWRTERGIKFTNASVDYHKGYGTPSVITVGGEPQLIAPAPEATIAYNPRTGKELWRVTTGGMNQSIKPIHAHGLIYLNSGHDQKLFAVRDGQSGNVKPEGIAWKAAKEAPTRPSVLVVGDALTMVNDKAVATCLDARTGKMHWRERFDGDFTASPVCAGGVMIFPNENGKTFVIEASKTYTPIAINKLDAGCMASPAIVDNTLLLRTKTHLYCIAVASGR